MQVLIDNCVVLPVKVHTLFFLNGEVILINLIKQSNTTFVNLGEAFICHILCDVILINCYQLPGRISGCLRSLWKISWCPSHFGIFIANKEEDVYQLSLRILTKKKEMSNQMSRRARSRYYYAMPLML